MEDRDCTYRRLTRPPYDWPAFVWVAGRGIHGTGRVDPNTAAHSAMGWKKSTRHPIQSTGWYIPSWPIPHSVLRTEPTVRIPVWGINVP